MWLAPSVGAAYRAPDSCGVWTSMWRPGRYEGGLALGRERLFQGGGRLSAHGSESAGDRALGSKGWSSAGGESEQEPR